MELTKEHFDQIVKGLATKEDLKPLATKKDLEEQTEALARMVADNIATPFTKRFDRLEELLEVKDDVQVLKHQMAEIRSALHLSM
jgi:hypothetical protein